MVPHLSAPAAALPRWECKSRFGSGPAFAPNRRRSCGCSSSFGLALGGGPAALIPAPAGLGCRHVAVYARLHHAPPFPVAWLQRLCKVMETTLSVGMHLVNDY